MFLNKNPWKVAGVFFVLFSFLYPCSKGFATPLDLDEKTTVGVFFFVNQPSQRLCHDISQHINHLSAENKWGFSQGPSLYAVPFFSATLDAGSIPHAQRNLEAIASHTKPLSFLMTNHLKDVRLAILWDVATFGNVHQTIETLAVQHDIAQSLWPYALENPTRDLEKKCESNQAKKTAKALENYSTFQYLNQHRFDPHIVMGHHKALTRKSKAKLSSFLNQKALPQTLESTCMAFCVLGEGGTILRTLKTWHLCSSASVSQPPTL